MYISCDHLEADPSRWRPYLHPTEGPFDLTIFIIIIW